MVEKLGAHGGRKQPESPEKKTNEGSLDRNKRSSEVIDKGRRTLLQGGVATLGVLAAPSSVRELFAKIAAPALGKSAEGIALKEKYVSSAVKLIQGRLRDPAQKRVPADLLRALEIPILESHIEGTSYDISELQRRYPLQVSNAKGSDEIIPAYGGSKSAYLTSGYGNGFYLNDRYTIATVRHITMRRENERTALEPGRSVDADIIRAGRYAAQSDEQVIHDEGLTDAEIDGELVAVIGIHPHNKRSDRSGQQAFLGVATRLDGDFARVLYPTAERTVIDHVANSYGIVLPAGENVTTAPGMSGASVWRLTPQGKDFCGMYWADQDVPIPGERRTLTMGLFHGSPALRGRFQELGTFAERR